MNYWGKFIVIFELFHILKRELFLTKTFFKNHIKLKQESNIDKAHSTRNHTSFMRPKLSLMMTSLSYLHLKWLIHVSWDLSWVAFILCVYWLYHQKILKGGEYLHYCDMNTEKNRKILSSSSKSRYIRLCSCINTCEGNCTMSYDKKVTYSHHERDELPHFSSESWVSVCVRRTSWNKRKWLTNQKFTWDTSNILFESFLVSSHVRISIKAMFFFILVSGVTVAYASTRVRTLLNVFVNSQLLPVYTKHATKGHYISAIIITFKQTWVHI